MPQYANEITLYALQDALIHDPAFSSAALERLAQIECQRPEYLRSTYSIASSASALINHWLVERKLMVYHRGRPVDDITDVTVSGFDGDFGKAADAYDAYLIIRCDELAKLSNAEGLPIPVVLSKGLPEKAKKLPESDDWRVSARAIADECFDNDTRNKCRDSLAGYSRRVMDEMQKRIIHGPRGLIDNPSTIQREALQGAKWWKGKTK